MEQGLHWGTVGSIPYPILHEVLQLITGVVFKTKPAAQSSQVVVPLWHDLPGKIKIKNIFYYNSGWCISNIHYF